MRLIAILLVLAMAPAVLVRGDGVAVVDAVTHVAAPLALPVQEAVLLVQGTYVPADAPRYVLTLSNLSPWSLSEIHVLDRFFAPESPEEQSDEWALPELLAGESASQVFQFEGRDPPANSHQLELNWSGAWTAFLVDQGEDSRTTIWSIPLTADMDAKIPEVPLSYDSPVGYSKLGLHVTRNSSPNIMAFVEETQPAVLVGVGDLGWLTEAKELSPGTVTLGRFEEVDQSLTGDPRVRAQQFVIAHAARYLANPGVDYWLGWNEPVIDSVWQMEWYAAFEAERARLMAGLGLRVAVGNFSTGTPEADEFSAFVPAVAAAKTYGGVLALHEYSAPTMQDGIGARVPGHEIEAGYGSLTLRYRYWYTYELAPAGAIVPLVITEAGLDGGVLSGPDTVSGGWRELAAGVDPAYALADYVGQLSWYDDELRRDPYVIGFAVFNAGDSSGKWASFDVTSSLGEFRDMMLAKR